MIETKKVFVALPKKWWKLTESDLIELVHPLLRQGWSIDVRQLKDPARHSTKQRQLYALIEVEKDVDL
jgi:hypothetical protein